MLINLPKWWQPMACLMQVTRATDVRVLLESWTQVSGKESTRTEAGGLNLWLHGIGCARLVK